MLLTRDGFDANQRVFLSLFDRGEITEAELTALNQDYVQYIHS